MNANGSGRQGVAVGVWPAVNRAGSSVAITQYASGGQSVIVTTKPNGTGRKIVGNATKQQSAGGPDYAPAGTRLAWYRVTYNKSGQGFAASDLFVRNGTQHEHHAAKLGQVLLGFLGAEWKGAHRDPRSADARLDEAQRHRRARADLGIRAHTGIASAVYSPDGRRSPTSSARATAATRSCRVRPRSGS